MNRSNKDMILEELEGQPEEALARVVDRLEALEAEATAPRRSLRGQSQGRAVLGDLATVQVYGEA